MMEACIDGKLSDVELEFEDNAAVCVVLASDGSPKRALYSKTFGPSSVIINPVNKIPVNGLPSEAIASIVD